MAATRVGLLLCEDGAQWSDLCDVWREALVGGGELAGQELGAGGQREEQQQEAFAAPFELVAFRAVAGELPAREALLRPGSASGLDALLVTGSRHSAAAAGGEAREWVERLCGLVRFCAGLEALDGSAQEEAPAGFRPRVLGVGFGSQLVARALGGEVGPLREGPVFGAEEVVPCEAAPLLPFWEIAARPLRLLQAHGECVTRLPPRALRLASSESCANEVFFVPARASAGSGAAAPPRAGAGGGLLGIQARPELSELLMLDRVLDEYEDSLSARRAEQGLLSLQEPHDSDRALAIVRAFLSGQSLVAGGAFAGAPGQLSRDALEARVSALTTQLEALREGFARELARASDAAAAAVAAAAAPPPRAPAPVLVPAPVPLAAAAAASENDTSALLTADDQARKDAAEAVLRGEGSAREVLAKPHLRHNAGDRAGLIASARSIAPAPRGPAWDVADAHAANALCCRLARIAGRLLVVSGGADKAVVVTELLPGGAHGRRATADATAPVTNLKLEPSASAGSGGVVVAAASASGTSDPNKTRLVGAGMDGQAFLAVVECDRDGAITARLQSGGFLPHRKHVTALAWSPCGGYIATAARDQALHVYSVAPDGVAPLLQLQCSGTPEALEFVRCFNCLCLVVAVRDDHCLQYVCVSAGGPQRESSTVEAGQVVRANMNARGDAYVSFCVLDLAAAPRGLALLAAATDKGQVVVFRTGTSRQYRTLYGHHCGEYARPRLAWDASARFLACTSDDDLAVHVWFVPTGEPLLQIAGHGKAVRDLHIFQAHEQQGGEDAADPWDAVAVSTGFDRTLKVWTHLQGL
jgi:hypothetical protein